MFAFGGGRLVFLNWFGFVLLVGCWDFRFCAVGLWEVFFLFFVCFWCELVLG